jgi:hypothetical protein
MIGYCRRPHTAKHSWLSFETKLLRNTPSYRLPPLKTAVRLLRLDGSDVSANSARNARLRALLVSAVCNGQCIHLTCDIQYFSPTTPEATQRDFGLHRTGYGNWTYEDDARHIDLSVATRSNTSKSDSLRLLNVDIPSLYSGKISYLCKDRKFMHTSVWTSPATRLVFMISQALSTAVKIPTPTAFGNEERKGLYTPVVLRRTQLPLSHNLTSPLTPLLISMLHLIAALTLNPLSEPPLASFPHYRVSIVVRKLLPTYPMSASTIKTSRAPTCPVNNNSDQYHAV